MTPPLYDEALYSALHCVAEGYAAFAEPLDLERLKAAGLIDLDQTKQNESLILTDVGRQTYAQWRAMP